MFCWIVHDIRSFVKFVFFFLYSIQLCSLLGTKWWYWNARIELAGVIYQIDDCCIFEKIVELFLWKPACAWAVSLIKKWEASIWIADSAVCMLMVLSPHCALCIAQCTSSGGDELSIYPTHNASIAFCTRMARRVVMCGSDARSSF